MDSTTGIKTIHADVRHTVTKTVRDAESTVKIGRNMQNDKSVIGEEIKKQLDEEFKKFYDAQRALEEHIKILQSNHNQVVLLLQKQCGALTGHKGDGGFMYSSCIYCGICDG